MIPRASYRLQFHKGFGFDEAARLAGYLQALGVSHVYASPYLKARPGSRHGYDIVDHSQLNPELGDEAAFDRMVDAFRAHELGQILDLVPNHMGVGGADNPLWLDVLEWGPEAAHAAWFDIDWDPERRYLHDKVLVPLLGDQYGAELTRGHLRLRFDEAQGSFAVWAYDTHKLPICPLQYARILGDADPQLERLGDAFSWAAAIRPQTAQRAKELKAQLCDLVRERPATREALYLALSRFDGEVDQAASWRELDALIRDQFWRVAHFRVAADDVNFRRFFNINDLAGVRVEVPQVFDHAHQRVLRLIKDGVLDGLRIDHIDGLLDPKGYLRRLRRSVGERHCYIVAEKILASHEWLPEDWPIEGTTGYDFANLALGLMVDPAQEASFSDIYAAFSGQQRPFGEIVRECKLHILDNEMASELNGLAREHARLARQNARTADFTQNLLRRALRALIACFPVYRTYVDAESPPDAVALRDIDWALAQASRHEMELDPSVFDFLRALLHGELIERPRSGFSRQAALRCVMKLQQLSGPVMAKGLEDTAFYRYNRFIALNEVGGSPERFGLTLAAVHKANAQRAQRWPHAMLGTSTHDSKHGEDVRARLAALSELPQEWAQQLGSWSRILRGPPGSREPTADGGDAPPQPDRNDEYLFYQLLLGTWPVELLGEELDPATLQQYRVRLRDTMIKSIREARLHSRWAFPDQSYEDATSAFIDGALDSPRSSAFLAALLPFARRIAALGAHNSLLQTVFKLTCPGMPDFYQGSELWELSMVDPDNRREVDFELRTRTLQQTRSLLAQDPGALVHLFRNWRDGAFKLATTAALLDHRRRHAAVFAEGTYDPLAVAGARADEVCAYARQCGEQALLVLLARFPHRQHLRTFDDDTVILLPPALQQRRWHDVLGGRELPLQAGAILGAQVFRELPVAVCYTPTEP